MRWDMLEKRLQVDQAKLLNPGSNFYLLKLSSMENLFSFKVQERPIFFQLHGKTIKVDRTKL